MKKLIALAILFMLSLNMVFAYSTEKIVGFTDNNEHYSIGQYQYPQGIFFDGTYWWVAAGDDDGVTKYNYDFTYAGFHKSFKSKDDIVVDIYQKDGNWYVLGGRNNIVMEYDSNWNHVADYNVLPTSGIRISEIIYVKDHWYILSYYDEKVHEFNSDFTATGVTYDLSSCGSLIMGMDYDGFNWWFSAVNEDKLCKFDDNLNFLNHELNLLPFDGAVTSVYFKSDVSKFYLLESVSKSVHVLDATMDKTCPIDDAEIVMNSINFNPGTICELPNGFSVGSNNVEINCNGAILKGDNVVNSIGVETTNSNVVIKNCNFENYDLGIKMQNNDNGELVNNSIKDSLNIIDIITSNNISISGNSMIYTSLNMDKEFFVTNTDISRVAF